MVRVPDQARCHLWRHLQVSSSSPQSLFGHFQYSSNTSRVPTGQILRTSEICYLAYKMSPSSRSSPVIIITGTPGTGKSTHAQLLAEESPLPLRHINVGELVKEKDLHEGYDEEWQSYTVDEDKVRTPPICLRFWLTFPCRQLLDELEPLASEGGIILDWHTCDIFPERWADLVVVLRCDHTKLWERLEKRYDMFPL